MEIPNSLTLIMYSTRNLYRIVKYSAFIRLSRTWIVIIWLTRNRFA